MKTKGSQVWESIRHQLQKDGYAVVDVLSAEEVSALTEIYLEQFHDKEGIQPFNTTMRVNDQEHRTAVDRILKGHFSDKVEGMLPGYRILFANFLVKRSHEDSKVGIHRDWTYVDESVHTSYNLWVPMLDINETTGLFHVLPGSHNIAHGPRATPFANDLERYGRAIRKLSVPVALAAGQGIIYHSGLIHHSDANLSSGHRLAAGMVLIPTSAQPIHIQRTKEPHQFRKYVVDESFFYVFDPEREISDTSKAEIFIDHTGEELTGEWLQHRAISSGEATALVGEYYDETTNGYLSTYGEAIQAFRPGRIKDLYNYLIRSAGLAPKMKILDAGCGIGGPANYFAQKLNAHVMGVTISSLQAEMARQRISNRWWKRGSVEIKMGDYHELTRHFESEHFDAVLFLESLGHSHDLKKAVDQAYQMLRPGGFIYIKDFFPFETDDPELAQQIRFVIRRINAAYEYRVIDLHHLISALRKRGFHIGFIKKFDFVDDITARAAFEEMFKIDLFGDLPEFRVAEWLEIKCIKPT